MVRRLVEQDQVAFLFNTLGTPTNSAIHKYVNAQKIPHLFVATGATKWGDPQHFPWTMGWQPTYQAEGRSEEHTSELQSQSNLVCRLLLEKKKKNPHTSLADLPYTSISRITITIGILY